MNRPQQQLKGCHRHLTKIEVFLVDIIGQKLVKNLTFFLKKSKKKAEKSTPTLVGEKCCSNCDLKRAFKLAKRPQV